MSALDQAFIKAYAKDLAVDGAAVATAPLPARPPAAAVRRASAQQVEQLYHNGSLYRVEASRTANHTTAVPAPHGALLPPTSPRRAVRRSVLRFLASQAASAPAEPAAEMPQRVARKVIIRHVSHHGTPAPRGRLRSSLTQSFAAEPDLTPPPALPELEPRAELAPETIADAPPAVPVPAAPPAIPAPAVPPSATPLNIALENVPPFEVHGYWKQGEPAPATLVLADTAQLPLAGAAPLVTLSLDALIAAEQALREHRAAERAASASEPAMPRFAGKSLDDHDQPQPTFRVDAEHGKSIHRPHARFQPQVAIDDEAPQRIAESPAAPGEAVESPVAVSPQHDEAVVTAEAIEAEAVEAATSATSSELSFAEPAADELTLLDEAVTAERSDPRESASPVAATKPVAPLWEIDRFQWPKTCQKLFADEQGYLASAGGKLSAAVQDGLKVLAVTGSRRGEGRSTLALCLARAAAQAGLQVALMDADFARPQIASKIGLEIAFGWQDAALGKVPLSEAAVKSLADHITVLPLEPSTAGRSLSLADPRVTATLRAAAATFELVVLDLGPLGPGEELAFPAGERCPLDAAIVVRDLRFATAVECEDVGRRLQDAGVEAVGIAENFVVEEELPATSV